MNPTSSISSNKLPTTPFTSRKRPATEHNGFNGRVEGIGQSPSSSSKINGLVSRLKERLEAAENQLQCLKQENIQLRGGSGKIAANMGSTINSNSEQISTGVEVEEVDRLKRALREAEARCSLFQSRLDNLEARGKAQHELHEGSVDQLEETNHQIHVLRRALADVAHERDVAAAKATRTDELEESTLSLRSQNRALEEQITHLCEDPFIAGSSDRSPRIQEAKWAKRASRAKVEHLKGVAQSNHETILALQKEVVKLRTEKDCSDADLQKLRLQVKASSEKESQLTKKMQLLGDEDGEINTEELERALTVVRRRQANPTDDVDFLELADEEEYLGPGPTLKRKLQQVQVANLAVTRELERAERMLQAQLSINRDLHLELEDLSRKKSDDKRELNGKLADVEALALDRLTTVHRLEAQIKQLIYNAARNDEKRGEHDTSIHGDSFANDKALLKDLAADGNFTSDENIIEVWIVSAELSDGSIPPESSCFFVIDFFDFESQTTSILSSSNPQFDFAATYKVTMDDFLLKYLGTESLVLELNKTRGADFSVVACCHIPLAQLLRSNPRMVLKAEPLFSVGDGRVCGHAHVEVRLALPVTELYELFLSRQPEEKARVEAAQIAMQKGVLSSATDGTAVVSSSMASGYPDLASITSSSLQMLSPSERDRTHNEIEIHVIRCEGLKGRKRGSSNTPPSAYVHYQLLGFQDVFTQVVSGSNTPCFTHSSAFPVMTDSRMLRFLHNHELLFTVMDDLEGDGEGEGKDSDNGGNVGTDCLMGEAKLSLAPLSDGNEAGSGIPINISDELGQVCGKLLVNVRWRLPLKTERDLGPNALTEKEVEDLIGRFSPTKDGQVQWVKFLKHANPPPAVQAGLERLYTYLDKKREKEGMATEGVFKFLVPSFKIEREGQQHTTTSVSISRDEFVSGLMSLPSLDIPPEELDVLFSEIDEASTGLISLCDILLVLEPPGVPARRLQLRLKDRCQEFALREGQPSDVFQRYDSDSTGRVSRLQFKEGLRSLGFKLIDEPTLPCLAAANWEQKYNNKCN